MIRVDRNKIEVPKIFFSTEMKIAEENLSKFYSGHKEMRSQKRFTQRFEAELRGPILKALYKLFNGKCAYCESKIPDGQTSNYDHFRPKFGARGLKKEFADEHYWWLSYEWRNFYNSCRHCNQYKASWFPVYGNRSRARTPYERILLEEKNVLIDPCEDNPEEHLAFDYDGNIRHKTERGRITINILKLNRKILVNERAMIIRHIYSDWEELIKIWRDMENNWDRIKQITTYWNEILTGSSERSFLAASRTIIKDRLSSNIEIQSFISQEKFKLKRETRRLEFDIDLYKDITPLDVPSEIDIESIDKIIEAETRAKEETVKDQNSMSLTQQIYLESLEVKNYKCFTHLKLNFKKKTLIDQQNWVLLLGENGVGKSSIIKAIAIALSPQSYLDKITQDVIQDKLLKKGKRIGFIELTYNGGEKLKVTFKNSSKTLVSSLDKPIVNLIGYGSTRLLPKNNINPEKGQFKGVKIQNLFDYSVALKNADEWLLKRSKKLFDRAAIALKDLMLLSEDDILIREENKIYIKSDSTKTLINDLSDGYRTIYALSVDIMSTLSSENITYDLAEGIILIDEIGTHLHPRWKMQVVERLRSSFPRLQFIVTTHEPLCLRGLKDKETFVLTRNSEGNITTVKDLPDPSELRIDQILTSDFFGLNSTLDPKTEAIFSEYYNILAKDEDIRSDNETIRLHELSELVPKIKHLGDNLRDELVYYVIDELLAKKVKRDGLKIKEKLKDEALERVESLWKSIDKNELK